MKNKTLLSIFLFLLFSIATAWAETVVWTGSGTETDPYIITTTEGLDKLASDVNAGNSYENTYFELGADITYVPVDADNDGEYDNNFTPIGFGDFEFYGKFDGKGHTVSGIVVNADQMGVGLFGHVAGSASIKNLTLAKSSFVSNQNNMGGIVGAVWGADVVIENCHVSAGVSVTGATFLGGIVGFNIGTISGSTSEAQVSGVQSVGGIVGSNLGVIENNLYLGNSVTATDNKVGAIAGYVDRGHPDCKASFTNNYHTLEGKGGIGKANSATGEDTDDAMLAKVVTEKPTDIGKAGTPYGTDDYVGITPYTRGLEYKDHFYYKPLWKGNGTEDEPYIITSTEGLDKLASDVNSGNQYKNTYFELGADITYEPKNLTVDLDNNSKNESNYTPIGNSSADFWGKFDGKGHTVSGIVVESNSDYVGLFGYVGSSVSIKNLTLANSSIKGNNNVGGIVGYVAYSSDTDPFVENCHVSANVLVKGGQYVGGIAGYNSEKIIGCTSDANVSGNGYVGGIVGENGGLVKNSLYLGKSVTATENSRVGAIAGYVSYEGSFTNNYHTLEGKGGEGNYTNMGSDTEGAEFAAPFSVVPAGIGTAETSYGTGDYVGITPYTNGLAYKGWYYYAGTRVGEGYAAVQIFEDAEGKKHAIIDGEYDGPDAVIIDEDIEVTSVTFNRKFATDKGGYTTLMLPFSISTEDIEGVEGVYKFAYVDDCGEVVDGKNDVCVNKVWEDSDTKHETLDANTPYIVKMKKSTLKINTNVTLKVTPSSDVIVNASEGEWQMRGVLGYKELSCSDDELELGKVWGIDGISIDKFTQYASGSSVYPFRAYLYNPNGEELGLCNGGVDELGSMEVVVLDNVTNRKKSLAHPDIAITGPKPVLPYANGAAICPVSEITVMDGKKELVEGEDYQVECHDNSGLGKAYVDIVGIGQYDGTVPIWRVDFYAAVQIFTDAKNNKHAIIDGEYKGEGAVNIPEDIENVSVEFNRTFTVDKYSTIVLPFGIAAGSVEGAIFYKIDDIDVKIVGNDTIWGPVHITEVTDNIEANTPYLLQPTATKLTFKELVTLNTSEKHPYGFTKAGVQWEFRGTYHYFDFANDSTHLVGKSYGFVAKDQADGLKVGQFRWTSSKSYILPMRGYLVYRPVENGDENGGDSQKNAPMPQYESRSFSAPSVSSIPETLDVEIVDKDGSTTVIGKINTRTGEIRLNSRSVDRWFDLQGRVLNGKPGVKGRYLHNGKIEIVK